MPWLVQQFYSTGYAVVADVLPPDDVTAIVRQIAGLTDESPGTRTLLELPWCVRVAKRLCTDSRVQCLLPAAAQLVQCTLFVKTQTNNWRVSLHQDLSIPVAERVECAGYGGWSQKEAQIFVQPPVSVLEEIVAVRLHLDDCDGGNGALKVVPGSHRLGRLNSDNALRERKARGEITVSVPAGSAMLMRPLLLHASSKAATDSPRRVLHYVFAPPTLPGGLRWPQAARAVVSD